MITIYSYKIAEGTLECPSLQELPSIFESDNVDLWVDLEAPTPEESEILHTVFDFHELAIEDCTAVDIEDPASAFVVDSIKIPNVGWGVCIYGDYALIGSSSYGIYIIDIDPPDTLEIFNQVLTHGSACDMVAANGHVYLADGSNGLTFVDVEPIGSAYPVYSFDLLASPKDIELVDNLAFIATSDGGLRILELW